MKKESIILYLAGLLIVLATSCVKVQQPFNSNHLTVTFNNAGANYVTSSKSVNGKDSLDFSYSGTSTVPMVYVTLTKNDTEIGRDSIKTGDKMSFNNLVKKFVADTIPGTYLYRVVARDKDNIYLGSSSNIAVTVNPDFNYIRNNTLSVPDTTAMKNKTYFNVVSQNSYSYSDITGGVNSNLIDFGYFWDPTILTGTTAKGNTFYNLGLSPVPSAITMYNTSGFATKNITQMKVITTPTWVNLNSGAILKAQCNTVFKTASANSVTSLVQGTVILFRTASGRCGAMNILFANGASPNATTSIIFDLKLAN